MHDVVFAVALLWCLALVGLLIARAARSRRVVDRVLALDSVVLVFVSALAIVAVERGEPGYLDVALVLAMLGFVQTVATVRLIENREDLS